MGSLTSCLNCQKPRSIQDIDRVDSLLDLSELPQYSEIGREVKEVNEQNPEIGKNQKEHKENTPNKNNQANKPQKTKAKWISQNPKQILDEYIDDQQGNLCGQSLDRVPLRSMLKQPHRIIGPIISKGPANAMQSGTGVLISKNLVLTAAHTIINKVYNAPYQSITFYPGQCGQLEEAYEIEDFQIPQEYMERSPGYKSYDYALLKLKIAVEEEQFLELCGDSLNEENLTTISIFGYPESRYQRQHGIIVEIRQYGLTRENYVLGIMEEAGYLIHRISTEKGQSGAPVIRINEKGKLIVIGIHVGSSQYYAKKYQQEYPLLKKVNMAKLVSRGMINRLKRFADKLEGAKFKEYSQEVERINQLQEEKQNLKEQIGKLEQTIVTSGIMIRRLEQKVQDLQKQKMDEENLRKSKKQKFIFEIKTAEMYRNEGRNFYLKDMYQQSAQSYRRAIEIEPTCVKSFNSLGWALERIQQWDKAIQCYRKAIDINPDYQSSYISLAVALEQLNKEEEALGVYRKIIQIEPFTTQPYLNIQLMQLNNISDEELMKTVKSLEHIKKTRKHAVLELKNTLKYLKEES